MKIEYIEFTLENCEGMKIPYENFKQFLLEEKDGHVSLDCIIEGVDNIEYDIYTRGESPLQRLARYDDISCIIIKFEDEKDTVSYLPMWRNPYFADNEFQTSTILEFNKIHIRINRDVFYEKQNKKANENLGALLEYVENIKGNCSVCILKSLCSGNCIINKVDNSLIKIGE